MAGTIRTAGGSGTVAGGSGGVDQQGQFVEARLGVEIRVSGQGDTDEHDLLALCAFDQRCAECFVVWRRHSSLAAPTSYM